MANVVPISQIPDALKQAVAGVINGLVALKQKKLDVRMPKQIEISMSVCLDTGINAIARTNTTASGPRQSTTTEGAKTKTSRRAPVTSTTRTVKGPEVTKESGTQSTTSRDTQTNSLGRVTETKITYES